MTSSQPRRRRLVAAYVAACLGVAVVMLLIIVAEEGAAVGDLARVGYDALGGNGARRYLVLANDPAELRPVGGYSGTIGLLSFDHLKITDKSFVDVYQIDLNSRAPFVQPPQALADHLLGDQSWQLADAAWSPDFPTSAQEALRLYTLETGDTNIDGVIAINTYAIDKLLEITGPISVPSYGVTVSAGDVTLTALGLTRGVSTANTQRKAFLNDLAAQLFDRIQHPSPIEATRVPTALAGMLRDRSLLMWLKDPAQQAVLAAEGFDGSVRRDPGDYVYVVEANVAPTSKYNLVVNRTDNLTVTLDAAGNAATRLDMQWQNDAMLSGEPYDSVRTYSTNHAGLYGAFVRVLTSASAQLGAVTGTSLNGVNGVELTSTEAGRAEFGNYMLIAPAGAELTYSWSTPSIASPAGNGEWSYQLNVQKQPGLRPMPLNATVNLPAGATITSMPSGSTVSGTTLTLNAVLVGDVQEVVRYRLP